MRLCNPCTVLIPVGVACLVAAGGRALTLQAQAPAGPSVAATTPVALVDEYCLSCHDEDHKKGGLSLETIAADDVARHPDVWEKVVRKLRARQMPPVGKERPDDVTYDAVIASLETSLDRAAAASPNPGRTATIRRLTRTEYQNAIRDLLALDVDVASLLPADESSYGFDNVTVGDLSPTLLDRYISAAEKISRVAVGRAEPFSRRRHHQDSAGPHPGRAPRRPADRHPRRRRGAATRFRSTASTRSRFD